MLFNDTFKKQKQNILDGWITSNRMDDLLRELGISSREFKKDYAEFVYDFFYLYTTGAFEPQAYPTARRFVNYFKDMENVIQIITLVCTEFKNQIIHTIFKSDKSDNDKCEAYTLFSDILDSNLSLILSEYSNYILENTRLKKDKLDILESLSVVSKTDRVCYIITINQFENGFTDSGEIKSFSRKN